MKELALVVSDRAGDYFSMIQSKFGFINELTLVITVEKTSIPTLNA